MKNIIFMKYGVHASETVASIVKRKQQEIAATGYSYWGYGGNFCHPLTQVQPFAQEVLAKGEKLYLVMSYTESKLNNEPQRCNHYSIDGSTWVAFDPAINVLGSKFALCIKDLQICDFELDLADYEVAVGASKGKPLNEYIRFRVDKACACLREQGGSDTGNASSLDATPDAKTREVNLAQEVSQGAAQKVAPEPTPEPTRDSSTTSNPTVATIASSNFAIKQSLATKQNLTTKPVRITLIAEVVAPFAVCSKV